MTLLTFCLFLVIIAMAYYLFTYRKKVDSLTDELAHSAREYGQKALRYEAKLADLERDLRIARSLAEQRAARIVVLERGLDRFKIQLQDATNALEAAKQFTRRK